MVGARDGDTDGSEVGWKDTVGKGVGWEDWVGEADGALLVLGDKVGVVEGRLVGKIEGVFVGSPDGETDVDGASDGESVGVLDGVSDGALVGEFDGVLDGEFDGNLLGEIDGDFDGNLLGVRLDTTEEEVVFGVIAGFTVGRFADKATVGAVVLN